MKILMINKFLHPKGGAETYVFKLGRALQNQGHEVQYFGMEHEQRIVGNRKNAYTSSVDFHNSSKLERLKYPIRVVYSSEARKKIRLVLDDFQPDVCHLNNFNYQLTPSIILEIRKWEKSSGRKCKIVYTAHDPQLVCPNHMCMNPTTHELCQKCLHGSFLNCVKGKCIHGSFVRSVLGAVESVIWHWLGVYRQIDKVVCCSYFLKTLLDTDPVLAKKTVALHNFVDYSAEKDIRKKDYVLYFGRYSQEKGIATLAHAAKALPDIPFIFAGSGPLEQMIENIPNIKNVGFKTGEELELLIREARFSVIPSEWYENCPFSVLESIAAGTPVLGANIGGIPELISAGQTGELFQSGDVKSLVNRIEEMWYSNQQSEKYVAFCNQQRFDDVDTYIEKLFTFYRE